MIVKLLPLLMLLFVSLSCSNRTHTSQLDRAPVPPPNAVSSQMRRQVLNAHDAGDGDYRVRQLRERLTANPDDLSIRLKLAAHYAGSGSGELATEHARLAAEKFPDSAEAQLALARYFRAEGFVEQAENTLSRFTEREPDAPAEIHSWLGILRDDLGRWQDAETAHRTAVSRSPGQASLHNNLGYNLLSQERHPEAAAEFRQALELDRDSRIARNNLGIALASTPEEAVQQWQSVSGPADAHNNLAAILIERKKYEEARKELSIALGYKRDHRAALNNLRLVSELDGQSASVPLTNAPSLLRRFAAGLRRVFVDTEERQLSGAAQSASR